MKLLSRQSSVLKVLKCQIQASFTFTLNSKMNSESVNSDYLIVLKNTQVFKSKRKGKNMQSILRPLSGQIFNIPPGEKRQKPNWEVYSVNKLEYKNFSKSLKRWILIPMAQSKQRLPGIPVKTPARGEGLGLLVVKQQ